MPTEENVQKIKDTPITLGPYLEAKKQPQSGTDLRLYQATLQAGGLKEKKN